MNCGHVRWVFTHTDVAASGVDGGENGSDVLVDQYVYSFCRRGSMLANISACESLRGGVPAAKPIEPDHATKPIEPDHANQST